jgi:hypothetical protein
MRVPRLLVYLWTSRISVSLLFAIFVSADLTYSSRTQEEACGTLLGLNLVGSLRLDAVQATSNLAFSLFIHDRRE